MKLSAKILMLVLFVVIAVGAILIFVKTQLAPPGNISFKDPYSAPLNADVEKVGARQFPDCRQDFARVYHKVRFMNQEQILNPEQADALIVKIDTAYGNRIVDYAYRIFNSSSWSKENLKAATDAIASLRKDQLRNGEKAITQDMENSFRGIDGVLRDYNAAMAFSRNTSFHSVSEARSKIANIDTYLDRPYLSNNAQLVSALNAMPGKIADSHYAYLSSQVGRLAGYRGMSENSYDDLIDRVNDIIDEYKSTNIYGPHKKSISALEEKANNLVRAAYDYYSNLNTPAADDYDEDWDF